MFVLAAEAAAESSFPTWMPPIIGLVFFALAALIVFSFRDVANRHRERTSAPQPTETDNSAHN